MLSEQLVPPVKARLEARLPGTRIRAAGSYVAVVTSGQVQPMRQAFVIPASITGGRVEAAAGAFVQSIERGITVMLQLPAYSETGAAELDPLEALVADTIVALAGWTPGDTAGVFVLRRGGIAALGKGSVFYGLEFVLTDHVRIAT